MQPLEHCVRYLINSAKAKKRLRCWISIWTKFREYVILFGLSVHHMHSTSNDPARPPPIILCMLHTFSNGSAIFLQSVLHGWLHFQMVVQFCIQGCFYQESFIIVKVCSITVCTFEKIMMLPKIFSSQVVRFLESCYFSSCPKASFKKYFLRRSSK